MRSSAAAGLSLHAARCACLVAVSAGLLSCTLGPKYRRPDQAVPAHWSDAGQRAFDQALPSRVTAAGTDADAWWRVFGDATLDQLVKAARQENLDVRQAGLRIAESRAQREVVAAGLYPSAGGTAGALRARTSPNGITKALSGGAPASGGGSAPPSTFNLFQLGFDSTWELDLFGKTRRSVEAADAAVRSSEAAHADALVSMTAEIARTYFALRGLQRRRDIAIEDLHTEERLDALVTSRNRSGLAPDSDVAAQQVQVAAARASLPQLDQGIAQNLNRLALLLAQPPGAVSDKMQAAPLPPLPPAVPVGLPGDLLRRRSDVREREADLAASVAQVGVARASFFPSVTLGLLGGLQSTTTSQLFDWSSRFLFGGGQVSVPIFSGGKLRAQLKLADLKSQEAALAYREAVLSAFHDVDNALIAYAGDQRRAADIETQLAGAKRSRDLAEARFRSGLAAYITVLDAQRQALLAEQDLADATVAAATDLVAVFKALGGGWEAGAADPKSQ
ncbi:MAG TPA: efflux transporter outer membrane subunit [Steroidobacteraceae bacterium]|jgi:NodT family efflux transporter outer membrane factor (OMF) lipoprotein|nr:efflux transporter outer membrane subunit [Steroidobacteraceae bacterium]